MAMDKNKTLYIIRNREILKIMADPLRSQILETLMSEKHTVKQVADKLGLAPSKLYYHFNLLEQHGLIEVVETRMVANMVEKHFKATFSEFEVDSNILSTTTEEGKEIVNTLINSTIDTTKDDILRSVQARYFQLEQGAPADPRTLILNRLTGNISNARVGEFVERIQQIFKDFDAADAGPGTPDAKPYAMMIAFYPSFYFNEGNATQESDNE
jgi:DNA-binding transcriptional ArsR family regulator